MPRPIRHAICRLLQLQAPKSISLYVCHGLLRKRHDPTAVYLGYPFLFFQDDSTDRMDKLLDRMLLLMESYAYTYVAQACKETP